jgi:LysM repeat protein
MDFDSYTVRPGDTLFKIAAAFYGDGNQWRLIYAANKATIKNPDVIQVGWVLDIPPADWQPPKGGTTGGTSGSLRRGSKGAAVRALQQDLVALGYGLDVDGDFGSATEAAVCDVQSNNGLTVDGIAGPATLGTIAELLEGEGEEDESEEDEEDESEEDEEDESEEDEEDESEEEGDEEEDEEDEDEEEEEDEGEGDEEEEDE